jgi:MFS family permease
VWADIISGTSVLLFPIIGTLFGLNIASLLVIAIFGAMFDPAGGTARKSLIQPLVEKEGLSLTKFNGTYEAVATIGTVIGPTAAALAISIIGVNATFYVIAVVFVFASATASLIPVITVRGDKGKVFSISNVVGETRLGVSTLWRDKPLLSLVGLYTMLTAIYMPVESIVLSRYFQDLDEPQTLGMLSPRNLVVISMSLIGAVVCGMAFLPGAIAFIGLGLALGLAFGPVSPLTNYLVQRRVPQHLHGPVFGTQFSLTHLALPAGTLALGLIVQSVAIAPLLFVIGALFIAVTLLVGFLGPLRLLSVNALPEN